MTARNETAKTETTFADPFGQPSRRYDIPKLQPRRFTDEHPMAMFAVIVVTAFISMVMLPGQRPAEAAISPALVETSSRTVDADKTDRLPDMPAEEACRGQAWGAESLDCLTMIARETTGEARRIRLVVADQINSSTPNVF